jgi:hypothetical protein
VSHEPNRRPSFPLHSSVLSTSDAKVPCDMAIKPAGRGPLVEGFYTAFLIITTIAILLRTYSRAVLIKNFALDDWFAVISWVSRCKYCHRLPRKLADILNFPDFVHFPLCLCHYWYSPWNWSTCVGNQAAHGAPHRPQGKPRGYPPRPRLISDLPLIVVVAL